MGNKTKKLELSNVKVTTKDKARTPKQLQLISQSVNAILATRTLKEASEVIGIDQTNLHRRLNNYPEIKQIIDLRTKDIREMAQKRLENNIDKYVDNIDKLADKAQSENVKLNANLELLDRAGLVKPTNNTQNVQVNVLTQIKKHQEDYDL